LGPGGKVRGEKEVIINFKSSGRAQSIPQEDPEHPGEQFQASRPAKNPSAGKEGKAGGKEEAVKSPDRQILPETKY